MAKVYAFSPPSAESKATSSKGSLGSGVYYASLGMRRSDVDKRLRMHGETGRTYLNKVAAFEARRNQMRGEKAEERAQTERHKDTTRY